MASKAEETLVTRWCKKFDESAAARRKFEMEWHTNLAFYFGHQWVEWTKSANNLGRSLMVPPAPTHRVRLVSNRVKPIVRKEISKINKERPHFYVVPATTDDADIAKARTAEAIAEHILINNRFHKKKREAIFWASVCGIGYIKETVNGELDIDWAAPSPFHIWVANLEIIDIQEQPWVCHGLTLGVEEAKARYNFDGDLNPDALSDTPDAKFYQSLGIQREHKEPDQIFIREFWVKPCREFPQGAMFAIGAKQLLYISQPQGQPIIDEATQSELKDESGEILRHEVGKTEAVFPFNHGHYPFMKVEHIPTGRFYTQSVIPDIIPLQKEYNRGNSQILEHRNLTVKPQWKMARGSADPRKITNMPGLIIEYTPGFDGPEPVRVPEVGSTVYTSLDRVSNDIDFISNQFEITQGRTPPNVEAASAIAFLQEEGDSVLAPTIQSLEEAIEEAGYQALELVKQYWPVGKTVKIVSGADLYEVIEFHENSLPDQIDFKIEAGSLMPKSTAAQRAFIIELMNTGVIPPIEALKYLELSQTNKIYADLQIDARHARRENFRMKQGETVNINPFDNHVGHILSHERFMKSQEFEMLNPQIQQVFIMHWQAHMQALGNEELNAGPTGPGESESGRESKSAGQSAAT